MTPPSSPPSVPLRLGILGVVAGCLFVALVARLWFLQTVNAPTSQAVALSNGVRVIAIAAPRGQILDRNGNVLVGNVRIPVIEVDRQVAGTHPAMLARLAALLGMSGHQLDVALADLQYSPYAPVPVAPDPTPAQVLYVQEHQDLFPGVSATTELQRAYSPMGTAAANVVGYVGQIPSALYQRCKAAGCSPGDQIGLSGVEATYNTVLAGQPGAERVAVDSSGRVLSVLSVTPPVAGLNLRLSIDGTLQQVAESAIEAGLASARTQYDPVMSRTYLAPAGSAVVEDPADGTILALATDPDYNPADFVGGISEARYQALQAPAANQPLLDRAIQGAYAPGSTFKLVTATAGLESGLISPTSIFHDTGRITIGNQVFHNDNYAAYGNIDLAQAITVSSDNYFNTIGAQLWDGRARYGPTYLQHVADEYGFGAPTGIALPDESAGLVPTPASVAYDYQHYPKDYATGTWYTGDSAQIAIGQFEDLVTPLQLANAYATFANGGTRYVPRLVLDAETARGTTVSSYSSKVAARVPLDPGQRQALLDGFTGVVQNRSGTAYGVFGATPLATMVAGKTGTAQVNGKDATSVFTSFSPPTNPRYVVDAFMEQAGYGASIAGPVVRQIYDQLYHLPLEPVAATAVSGAQN